MAEYFGACDATGQASGSSGNSDAGYTFWHAYTCPGSGNVPLSRLEACVNGGNQSGVVVRLAIYDSAGTTRLAQTDPITLPAADGDDWQGGPVSLVLTGGTDYVLAYTVGGSTAYSDHCDETRSAGSYASVDYSTGFPSSLPAPGGSYWMYPVRARVPGLGAQIAEPCSLSSADWTGSAAALADTADATYLESPNIPRATQVFVCDLAALADPVTYGGHAIRVRAQIRPVDSGTFSLVFQIENTDDDSVVATLLHSDIARIPHLYPEYPDTIFDTILSLSEEEAALIHRADGLYTGLRIRGWAVEGAGIAFAWDEVEGATSYVLQIGSATGQSDVVNTNVGYVRAKTVLLGVGTWYARVVVVGGAHDGELTPGGEQEVTI